MPIVGEPADRVAAAKGKAEVLDERPHVHLPRVESLTAAAVTPWLMTTDATGTVTSAALRSESGVAAPALGRLLAARDLIDGEPEPLFDPYPLPCPAPATLGVGQPFDLAGHDPALEVVRAAVPEHFARAPVWVADVGRRSGVAGRSHRRQQRTLQ